jgi:hypothetical protein
MVQRVVICTVVVLLSVACLLADEKADKAAVKQTVQNYLSGVDSRDTTKVEKTLPAEHIHFVMIGEQLRAFDGATFLSLLQAQRIGGKKREHDLKSIDVTHGETAAVKATSSTDKATFIQYFTLMKIEESWQIMSIVTKLVQAGT